MLRMNLNTFARHGVFDVKGFTGYVVARLADKDEIHRAKVFPYQLMAAYTMAERRCRSRSRGTAGRDGNRHRQRTRD